LIQVINTETEHIIAGSGELHLEICLRNLVEEYAKIEIIKSEPIVPYKETITAKSSIVCLAKSANKHNRISIVAEPLQEELVESIEKGLFDYDKDYKQLVEIYKWDQHDAKKLWCFGPDNNGSNVLVDQTQSVQYLNEVRDSIESSLQWVSREGVLAEETMRGIRFNIVDAQLHRDPAHRGSGQIIQTARRAYYASQLSASPRFLEPVYQVDISTPIEQINSIYQFFSKRRGLIFSEESVNGIPLINLKAYLPVAESFGFASDLRDVTSGKAFPQMFFDHWEIINFDPLDSKSKAFQILSGIRKRKGLKIEIPNFNDYYDKI